MNLKKNIFSIVLIVVGGIVCLFHLGVKAKNMIFMAGAEETTGYVVDLQTRETHTRGTRNSFTTKSHVISVEYTVDEQVYTRTFNSGSFGISEGRRVTVYYKEKNPSKAVADIEMEKELDFVYPVMLGVGILFLFADKKEEN
ncbi:MAG: DUF3592 domain-containing protein [Lachnospiraceae bacterium]|nr:DUF3592 domain-containing protein [Lachnospiraceae bacterium]